MITRVPDYFEPIVAYRGWNVDKQGFLTSANTSRRWKARKAVRAICTDQRDGEKHWHPETGATMAAPVAGCTCGYYAFKTDPVVDEYHCTVRGSVKLWGKIIEHDSGYRAEFAYPFKVRCASVTLAARIRHLYGIECVVDESMDSKSELSPYDWIRQQVLAQMHMLPGTYVPHPAYIPYQVGQPITVQMPQRFDVLVGVGKASGQMKVSGREDETTITATTDDDVKACVIPDAPSMWGALNARLLKLFWGK